MLTFSERISSSLVFSGIILLNLKFFCVAFVDRSLSFFLLAILVYVSRFAVSDYTPLISFNFS